MGAAPYLLFIPIADGDAPKPAGPARTLLDGWAYQDTHETLNTFTWGPDGWLYGCHGVFTHSNIGKPGTPENERTRINAGVWRFHPSKEIFEVFAEGTSNPWGVDFDEHGQCFIEACVIPHLFHMIQGGRYQRQAGSHFNPYIYDDIKTVADHVHWAGNKGPHAGNARSAAAGGGHAHAGLLVYQGDNWPEKYRGQLFMNNIHGARLNMDTPKRQGSGVVGQHNPDFIEFNDKWSQVLNMITGPDGGVYMIDWYDKNECHHNDVNGHDRSNGRIFKITYSDPVAPKAAKDLSQESDENLLLHQLQSANANARDNWLARHARRVLQERAQAGKLKTDFGNQWVQSRNAKPLNQNQSLRLLWAKHVTTGLSEADALGELKSPHEYVRAWTIQLLCESKPPSAELRKEFVRLAAEDPSPVVRLYLAAVLQRLPVEQRWEVVENLYKHAEDAGDHNLPSMVWYAAEPLAAKDTERALLLAQKTRLPNVLNFTVRRAAALNSPEAFASITAALGRTANDDQKLDILNGLSFALKGRRTAPMPKGWAELETKLGASSHAEIRAQVQAISLTFGSTDALGALKKTLADRSADPAARRTAYESLLGAKEPGLPALLQDLLSDPELRGPALRGLATYDDPKTPPAILGVYPTLNETQKREALNTLVSRAPFARELLSAVGSGRVPKQDLTADLVRQLRNLKAGELDEQIVKVWGVMRESGGDKQKEIAKYRDVYRAGGSQPGDGSRGRAVFAKVCAQCHVLFDSGGKVGPDLTGSNRGDLDYILQNIVDPNAVIPNDYRAWNLDTTDDRSISGILKQQDEKAVTLVTATETVVVPRNEIKLLKEGQLSMMPEGLLQPLNDQEVRDLIYYVRGPGQAPLPASNESAAMFFNGKDLAGWDGDLSLWKVENGEIVGRTTSGLKHNEFLKSQLTVEDFRLVVKVKLVPNKENSGIQFRSDRFGDYEMKGPQADIGAGWWGKLYEENGRALLWNKPGEGWVNPEQWNTYEILAVGGKVRTAINGHLCVDLEDPKISRRGMIALQAHAGGPLEVRFKDLQLELNPKFELRTSK